MRQYGLLDKSNGTYLWRSILDLADLRLSFLKHSQTPRKGSCLAICRNVTSSKSAVSHNNLCAGVANIVFVTVLHWVTVVPAGAAPAGAQPLLPTETC
jgi:hypothetical protein